MAKASADLELVKEKIKSYHDDNSAKSCLKSPLAEYLNLLSPPLDLEAMTKLLDKDVEICH